MSQSHRAVVLLSGGLDSAVSVAIAQSEGFAIYALTIDYGQRHAREIDAARRVADALSVKRHLILPVDLTKWGGSALTDTLDVPMDRTNAEIGTDIPITYVPARNTIFLSLAMGWAETLDSGDIVIGAHALDYSGYPDCRPEYFRAFEQLASLATRSGVERTAQWSIHTPLIDMTKSAIVRRGVDLKVPFHLTLSCYQTDQSGTSCGRCDACTIRLNAFAANGIEDPIPYVTQTTRLT